MQALNSDFLVVNILIYEWFNVNYFELEMLDMEIKANAIGTAKVVA